jgi:flagellar motor switch protein FliN/FliY
MAEATASEMRQNESPRADSTRVEVNEAELPEAVDGGQRAPGGQIDILMDAMLVVSARLGEARLAIKDLLALAPGAVLELDREVGEPIDLYLRGVRFARGNLVVVGERLGVRITEIVPSEDASPGQEDIAK